MTSRDPDHHRPRRAVLVFADRLSTDLARRRLPAGAAALLKLAEVTRIACGGAEIHVFTPGAVPMAHATVHRQVGRTFAARFENAVEELHGLGFSEIVVVGRDCPELNANDIALAFAQLSTHDLVLGPDHRGGCYLIGFHARNRHLLHGVRWNRNTDCVELSARGGDCGVFLLPVKQDLDSWADVGLLASSGSVLNRLAAFLLKRTAIPFRKILHFVDLAAHLARVRGQMPPPASAH